uniref:Putative secreted peptide n=1 Tax=Anopheles braziliensis TaxID=58242 RepID=A0A2M3ZU86_9DIPT
MGLSPSCGLAFEWVVELLSLISPSCVSVTSAMGSSQISSCVSPPFVTETLTICHCSVSDSTRGIVSSAIV